MSGKPTTPPSSASEKQSTSAAQTPQEAMAELESAYIEKLRNLNDLKDQVNKLKDQVISEQESSFKAFQQLVNYKEQYLVSIIKQNQSQQSNASKSTPVSTQQEQRSDNL